MKFTQIMRFNSGQSSAMTIIDTISRVDKNKLTYTTNLVRIDVSQEVDADGSYTNLLVDLGMQVYHNGNGLFYFDSTTNFKIDSSDTEPDTQDLKKILEISHKRLFQVLNQKKLEFKFLSGLADTHPDTILQYLPQLQKALLPLYEH